MARKSNPIFPGRQKALERAVESVADRAWMALGIDTSMTAVSVVGMGCDPVLDKMVGPVWGEMRWMPEDDYYKRLADAAHASNLIHEVTRALHSLKLERTFIAIEEPWYYGATKTGKSAWLKQQAEISGAFLGGLTRWGWRNIFQISNSQWRSVLSHEGVKFVKGPESKFQTKEWAIDKFGLPEFPDLVASKSGAKIPRPESGYGAKAKAKQPSDIYDAAACCKWMLKEIDRLELL